MLGFLNIHSHRDTESEMPEKQAINNRPRRSRQTRREANYRVVQVAERKDLARVDRTVSQAAGGRVIWNAVSFPARCVSDRSFECGTTVRVLYRQGNTLLVDTLASPKL